MILENIISSNHQLLSFKIESCQFMIIKIYTKMNNNNKQKNHAHKDQHQLKFQEFYDVLLN